MERVTHVAFVPGIRDLQILLNKNKKYKCATQRKPHSDKQMGLIKNNLYRFTLFPQKYFREMHFALKACNDFLKKSSTDTCDRANYFLLQNAR